MALGPGLEDDRSFNADNALVAGEVIVGEVLEMLHVPDGDVGQQVEAASEEEDLANFGDLVQTGDERIDGIALMAGEFHVDQGFHAEAQFFQVDFSVGAAQQAGIAESLQALVARGRG